MINVSWHLEGGEFVLAASLPPNTTAEIKLPGSAEVEIVGSGDHSYRIPYEAPQWPPMPIYPPFTPA